MKIFISLLLSAFYLSVFSQEKENGFEIFIDTCNKFQTHLNNSDRNVWGYVYDHWEKGGKIKFETLRFTRNQTQFFESFNTAAEQEVFTFSNKKNENLSTDHSYLQAWAWFNKIGISLAINKYQARSNAKAYKIINDLNKLSLKVANGGTYIHLSVHYQTRNKQLPLLNSLVRVSQESQLKDQLPVLIQQLKEFPKILPHVEQEFRLLRNETDSLFKEWDKNLNFTNLDNLLSKNGSNYSSNTMKKRTLDKIAAIHNNVLNDKRILDVKTSVQLREELLKEMSKIKNGFNSELIIFDIQKIIKKQNKTEADIIDLYNLISDKIYRDILSQTIPSVTASNAWNTRFKTKELLLINQIATRLYQLIKKKNPTSTADLVSEKILEQELIIDPYSNMPLKLIGEGKNIKVYSVYEDFDDDKGISTKKGGDLILTPLKSE